MPNERTPISRTKRNSQFVVQAESLTRIQKINAVPEIGAIIECESIYYVGNGSQWMPFAPIDNTTLQTGWARYDDGQYNIGRPYNFTTSAFFVPNDAAVKIDSFELNAYNGIEFTLDERATYSLTIAFKAHLNTNNGHLQVNLNCSTDEDYSRIGDVIVFPKGNGVEHTFSRVFNFYANSEAVRSGLKVKMIASHAGSIYDVIYYIEKLSHA